MAQNSITVRLNKENTELIKRFAKLKGRSVTAQVNRVLQSYLPLYVATQDTPITRQMVKGK